MNFREWITAHGEPFWEISDVSTMDTSGVHFEPLDKDDDDFDEEEARNRCEREVDRYWDSSDYYDGIYDDPSDDPNFDQQTADDWEEENPPPDEDKFKGPDGELNQEAYDKAMEEWQEERDEVDSDYHAAVESWKEDQQEERNRAEERESEGRWEAVSDCVDEKRQEWEEEHQNDSDNGGYKSQFQHGGMNFEVNMERVNDLEYQGKTVPGAFSITFQGPNGYSTTGQAGGAASAIYSQLLLAVKKLFETEKVNALTFYPAEPAMGLVYQRFYTQFLKKDFLRVTGSEYVRKDYIREVLAKKPDYTKKDAYRKIVNTNRSVQDKIKQVQAEKLKERETRRMIPKMIGRVVYAKVGYWDHTAPVFVVGQVPGSQMLRAVMLSDPGYAQSDNKPTLTTIKPTQLITDQQPDTQKIAEFLHHVAKDTNFLHSAEAAGLRALLSQYGIGPQPTGPDPAHPVV